MELTQVHGPRTSSVRETFKILFDYPTVEKNRSISQRYENVSTIAGYYFLNKFSWVLIPRPLQLFPEKKKNHGICELFKTNILCFSFSEL